MRTRFNVRAALAFVLIATLCMTLTACPADSQKKAAIAMRDFAVSVKAFQQAEIAYAQMGKIDPDTHRRVQAGILHLATTAPAVDAAIAQNNKAGLLTAIDAGLADTDGFLADVGAVQDPQTRAELQSLVLAVRLILANGKVLVQ